MASPRGRIEEEKCVVSVIIMEMGLGDKSLVNERLTGKGRTGKGLIWLICGQKKGEENDPWICWQGRLMGKWVSD